MVSGEMYYPHPYQQEATRRIIEDSHVGLFLDMGLGKTVATLTAIEELMHDRFEVRKCLVIAPLRVASLTWSDEVNRWSHLNLRMSKIIGTASERLKALKADADVYTINRENVPWLVDTCADGWPFDMVVVDESSRRITRPMVANLLVRSRRTTGADNFRVSGTLLKARHA